MSHTPHEFQQYIALAADRHRCLLADAAAHRLAVSAVAAVGPVRRLRWALGDLLLIAGARLTAGRPRAAATVHSSSS